MQNSSYSIEDCGVYRESFYDIGIPVYIFESHNQALPAWGTVCSRIGEPLNLITFDTHNDTRAPFNKIICENGGNPDDGIKSSMIVRELGKYRYWADDFDFEDVLKLSYQIENDEHIKTAYDFGYLKSYCVIHREDADGFENYDNRLGYQCKYFDSVGIDWEWLNCIEEPIALDFDLDFFVRRNDFDEVLSRRIQSLIHRATVITIAKEESFFEKEKIEADFSNDEAMKNLVRIIRGCRDS